jgi:LmbE family N-acetylglucosaminyl deacetylase
VTDRARLLAILAHPDDESFGPGGTLARYAREGAEVHVCIITDGAAGTYMGDEAPGAEAPALARLRRQELACACEVLGVQLITLAYRDSGMEGAPDNRHPQSLYQADLEEVAGRILEILRRVRPQVVITHDPTGGLFHPDHVRVNRAVCRAWERIHENDTESQEVDLAATPRMPDRLYYTVIPRSLFKWFLRVLRLLRRDIRHFGANKDIDLTHAGVPDEQIHVQLEVAPYLGIKERASACHKSQGGGVGGLRLMPGWVRQRLMRYEFFVQARPPDARAHQDLFEGLPVDRLIPGK